MTPTVRVALRRLQFVLVAFAFVALAGCKGVTPIKELVDDPARFEGKEVRIAGTVSAAVGLLNYGAYKVDDGTGVITVVTQSGGAPREGARVGVEGRVKAGYTLGSETLTVFLEDRRRSP